MGQKYFNFLLKYMDLHGTKIFKAYMVSSMYKVCIKYVYDRYQVCIKYVYDMYQVCICIVWFPHFVTHFPVLSLISLMVYIGYSIHRDTYGIHRDTYGIHRDTYGIHRDTYGIQGIHTVYRVHPQSIRRVSLAPPSERWKKRVIIPSKIYLIYLLNLLN